MTRSITKSRLLPLVCAALVLALPRARAATQVVNVCGRDDAAGGLNLATALAAGGDIAIRCPAGQNAIAITVTRNVAGIASIDGDGKVTLRGPVAGPLFSAAISLRLVNLTVENPRTAATAASPGAGAIILGAAANVELSNVTTQNSLSAYSARSFTAQDSRFLQNGDPNADEAFGGTISADRIVLRHATFTGNFEHAIAGGSTPDPGRAALSRDISITDSTFSNNRASVLLTDARVNIAHTQFQSNGIPRAKWGEAWECCGGALTIVRSDAQISGATFTGNLSPGFGGAIYSLGSRVRLDGSVFQNNTARAGGAIAAWGHAPKVNIWSTGDAPFQPRLELSRTEFKSNSATVLGGAVVFAGIMSGNSVLFQSNTSATAGGAIADWNAVALPDPFGSVMQALIDASLPTPPNALSLARPIMVDNTAASRGAALAVASAAVAVGNGLIARNKLTGGSGAAIFAAGQASLVNTTIADNPAGGIASVAGAALTLGNAILLRNQNFNCSLGGASVSSIGGNFEYPLNDCGSVAGARDPGLDSHYSPALLSAARGAGITAQCSSNPLVLGVDLFVHQRLSGGHCDSGAIELPFPQAMASALGFGTRAESVPRLLTFLAILILLIFLIVLFCVVIRRRRRR